MSVITVELPNEIAAQFGSKSDELILLLKEALALKLKKTSVPISTEQPIYQELVDLLSSAPTNDQLIKFKISETSQERLENLLYRNREEELSQTEMTELETYLQLSRIVTRLKAHAKTGQPFLN